MELAPRSLSGINRPPHAMVHTDWAFDDAEQAGTKTMCFSATASFVAAGLAGAAGAVSVSRVERAQELPLAAIPLLFAFQQGMEGLLWLTLPVAPDGATAKDLTLIFLLMAGAFWPVYAPIAVALIEPENGRRRVMHACLAVGAAVSGYMLWWTASQEHEAVVQAGHIVYMAEFARSKVVVLGYLAATLLPLLLSSHRAVNVLGGVVLIGYGAAYAFYVSAFVSIWCFFAAAASVVILWRFERAHRRRLPILEV